MWLVKEARSDAVKSNTAWETGMLGPWIKANWKWSTGDGKNEHWHFRNQQNKWTGMCELTQIDITFTTVGKNPLEEME